MYAQKSYTQLVQWKRERESCKWYIHVPIQRKRRRRNTRCIQFGEGACTHKLSRYYDKWRATANKSFCEGTEHPSLPLDCT